MSVSLATLIISLCICISKYFVNLKQIKHLIKKIRESQVMLTDGNIHYFSPGCFFLEIEKQKFWK